jgi:hypothetical protein
MGKKSTKIETKFCEFWISYKIFVWEIQLWFLFLRVKGNEFIRNNGLIQGCPTDGSPVGFMRSARVSVRVNVTMY